jgi:hypothetical protein
MIKGAPEGCAGTREPPPNQTEEAWEQGEIQNG